MEIEEIKELHRLQLTGISVISFCNTIESLNKTTIDPDNPYWTPAFDDVQNAVKREIELISKERKGEQ